ncbi:hypothetical protein ABZ079_05640 [Streptomyces sp. NPDC006314]|uniref:hypothetical protein n=1 Tax=Streptomyces sp. NPDC006314 TaxID=3154475 RepID=UPI0033B63BB6
MADGGGVRRGASAPAPVLTPHPAHGEYARLGEHRLYLWLWPTAEVSDGSHPYRHRFSLPAVAHGEYARFGEGWP